MGRGGGQDGASLGGTGRDEERVHPGRSGGRRGAGGGAPRGTERGGGPRALAATPAEAGAGRRPLPGDPQPGPHLSGGAGGDHSPGGRRDREGPGVEPVLLAAPQPLAAASVRDDGEFPARPAGRAARGRGTDGSDAARREAHLLGGDAALAGQGGPGQIGR